MKATSGSAFSTPRAELKMGSEAIIKPASALRKLLLFGGILASVTYFLAWVLGAMQWPGYNSVSQAVSELSALGAPSRPLMLILLESWSALTVAFGLGILASSGANRPLRVVGWLTLVLGVVSLAGPLTPMHMRGAPQSLTDTMHIVMTIVDSVLIFLMVGFGAASFGPRFRIYSLATIFVMVLFGTLAALDGPRLVSNQPTPWLGLTERVDIGAYLLWVMVFARLLWRDPQKEVQK